MNTSTVLADGMLDTVNNLTGQGKETLIGVVSAIAIFIVAKQFVSGGVVAGIIAAVLGGVVLFAASNMDMFKDKAKEDVNSAPAISVTVDANSAHHEPASPPGVSAASHVRQLPSGVV